MFWNNQPHREASSLVRKGVGWNTILRAVKTPYPTVNLIQCKTDSNETTTVAYSANIIRISNRLVASTTLVVRRAGAPGSVNSFGKLPGQ